MTSMAQLATVLQRLLTTVADQAARETGFSKRVRRVTGALFVQTLMFGWRNRPQASYSELQRMGGTCGLTMSSQGWRNASRQRRRPACGMCWKPACGNCCGVPRRWLCRC